MDEECPGNRECVSIRACFHFMLSSRLTNAEPGAEDRVDRRCGLQYQISPRKWL